MTRRCERPALRAIITVVAAFIGCGRSGNPATNVSRNPGDSLLAAAESLLVHEKYDSARTTFRAAVGRARADGNQSLEGKALAGAGLASYRLGDLKDARASEAAAVALKGRIAGTSALSKSYSTLGLVSLAEGKFAEAAGEIDQAIESAKASHDSAALAKAYSNRGLVAMNLGDLTGARNWHRSSRAMSRAIGNSLLEANGLTNEANVDIWEGDARPAIARLDSARSLYQRVRYSTGEEVALSELATAYELTGDLGRAFAALDTAIALARRLHMATQEAEKLRLLAGLHVRIGDYRRAVAYYDDAIARMRASGYEELPSALRGSAEAHLRLGNLQRARANAEEAVRADSAAHEPLDELDDLRLLAEINFRSSGLAAAEPPLRAAFAIANQLDTRGSRIAVAVAEAHLADLARDPQRALRALRGVAPDLAAGDYGAEWETSALAARAYARLNRLDSAVVAGRRAIAAVERLRGELALQAVRGTFVADRAEVYSDLAVALLRLHRDDEAFTVADAARGGELLRALSAARTDARAAGATVPAELLEGEDLLRHIDDLVQRLRESERGRRRERGSPLDSADASLAAQLAAARGEYEALAIRVAQQRPRAAALFGAEPARASGISAALDRDEALVEYLFAPDRVLIFVVTRSGLHVVQGDTKAAAITQRVRLLRDLWGSPSENWKWGLDAARALHHALIAPVRDAGLLTGVRRLTIVPHGILGQTPFAALVDERSGRYLMQDYAITLLPSAAALSALRAPRTTSKRPVGPAVGFAPFPDELPATKQEVAAFQTSMSGAIVRTASEATELQLRRALANSEIVHVATHGVLNARNPMFSRIELARPESFTAGDDGRLEVHELLGLGIRSGLVFLSGCETGAVQEWTDDPVRGAAELTLAQAFLSAGAENVVVTLWRIDDAGAAIFARDFYRALRGQSFAEAVATVQRSMSSDPHYASPYYWAGYILSGSGAQEAGSSSVSTVSATTARSP
jgi:CHAT domain-containing protein/Tfp pilus assembly protein PilF